VTGVQVDIWPTISMRLYIVTHCCFTYTLKGSVGDQSASGHMAYDPYAAIYSHSLLFYIRIERFG